MDSPAGYPLLTILLFFPSLPVNSDGLYHLALKRGWRLELNKEAVYRKCLVSPQSNLRNFVRNGTKYLKTILKPDATVTFPFYQK